MKTIRINFATWGYCHRTIEVDDDYQLPSSNSIEFWEDILDRYPEYEDSNLFENNLNRMREIDIEDMGLDFISSITIKDEDKKVILNQSFKKIQYS